MLFGPPGAGKTQLTVGVGLKAVERDHHVLFTRALAEGRLDEKLKLYTVPRLLIDEIGYLPIDQAGANLILTTHQPPL